MSPRSSHQKLNHRGPTPRLLTRSLWPWICLAALVAVFSFAALRDAPAEPQSTRQLPPYDRLQPEPPVELLAVENSGFPCDVERVLKDKCRRCHTRPSRHAAPFALLTWAETRALRNGDPIHKRMRIAIENGSMPLQLLANPPVLPLTPEERETLLEWLDQGAPRGECSAG